MTAQIQNNISEMKSDLNLQHCTITSAVMVEEWALTDMHVHGALIELRSVCVHQPVIQLALAQLWNSEWPKGVGMLRVEYMHTPAPPTT